MKLALVSDHFTLPSPGQQLLDRFLIGYRHNGEFRTPQLESPVTAFIAAGTNPLIEARTRQFGLRLAGDLQEAVGNSDAAMVVNPAGGGSALLEKTISAMKEGGRCFVCGVLGADENEAQSVARLASLRKVTIATATAVSGAFLLPEIKLPGERVQRGLIVVQGEFPRAELDGLEGIFRLFPLGVSDPLRPELLRGDAVWTAGEAGRWSKELLRAALSRSNTIQGDPVKDGRPQDVAGLGLVERLTREPRGWMFDVSGRRFAILVLNGVCEDINIAFDLLKPRETVATQLYQPPTPMQEHYSNLAARVDDFFRTGERPWPLVHSLTISQALGEMSRIMNS